jgi:hypothetical protein
MNLLYWNIRGIANFDSKIALCNLFLSHTPGIIFLRSRWFYLMMFLRGTGIVLVFRIIV